MLARISSLAELAVERAEDLDPFNRIHAKIGLEIKIHYEEQLMTASFPRDYPAYRRRVPQLIPGLGGLRRQVA